MEVLSRYAPEDVVYRAVARATPILYRQMTEIAAALEAVLATASPGTPSLLSDRHLRPG